MRKGTTRKDVADMTLEECREEYRRIRARAWQCVTAKEFDAKIEVPARKGEDEVSRARRFVTAAREATHTCRRCAGTGRFITGTLNGQPTGPGGDCYRCDGKGYQDDEDARRNYGADIHQKVY